jgi:hypothetical protein
MIQGGAELCIASHRSLESSRGSKDCIRQALAVGISVHLIQDERAILSRIQKGDSRLV